MVKKHTIEEMRQIAESRGGKCLSDKYVNTETKLVWQCGEGHQWETTPESILYNHWCPLCYDQKRGKTQQFHVIEDFQKIAKSNNGECLSTEFINETVPLKFRCVEGHIWSARPQNILNGTWCRLCKIQKNTIEKIREIVAYKGGELISRVYTLKEKLSFKCKNGHEWKTRADALSRGDWCPLYQKIEQIKKMHQIALEKGGECLSSIYQGSGVHLKWKCKNGHEWKATPEHIKKGHWCIKCAHSHHTIEDMKKAAFFFGGKCLSENYINMTTQLDWECEKGHKWHSSPKNVLAGHFCPICRNVKNGTEFKQAYELLKNRKSRELFNGVPYVLCLIDFSHLHNSFQASGMRGINKEMTERLMKRVPYLSQRPLLMHAYIQEGLPDYTKIFPEVESPNYIVKWWIEDEKKFDSIQKRMVPKDIDPQMVAEGTCQINNAGKQISHLVIASADKDMEVLLRFAKKQKIPITIVTSQPNNIANDYAQRIEKMGNIIYLKNTK